MVQFVGILLGTLITVWSMCLMFYSAGWAISWLTSW